MRQRRFKIVDSSEKADFSGVLVTLFRRPRRVCGWYIGPASLPLAERYLPESANLLASLAVIRALTLAEKLAVEVCIVDPNNLWDEAWGSAPSTTAPP